MTQIESSRPSQSRKAAAQHVSREILPKRIETEQAKIEKAATHGTTNYVKAKKTEKTVNRQGGPVLKPEKSRGGRKSASEGAAARVKTAGAAAAQGQKTSDAARSDAFDKFKDVVGKITEGAKLVTGLINEFKGVGVAIKDFVCALKGECKPAAAPAPGAPAGGAAPAADAAGAPPAGTAAEPAAQDSADPVEALRRLRQTFETILSQVEDLLQALRSGLDPANLGKKDQAKAWSGVSNGLGYPLTVRGEIADPESFKLWTAALPPAAPSSASPASQPAPPAPAAAPVSAPPAPAAAPVSAPDAALKPDNPYVITQSDNSDVRINTIQQPNIAPKSAWRNDLMGAIDRVQAKGTGLDPDDRNKIVDPDAYHQAVALEMRALGFLSFHDGEEIQVTRPGANHSEHFDISTASGLVRRFYASWISPPAFEAGPGGPPAPGGGTPAPGGGTPVPPGSPPPSTKPDNPYRITQSDNSDVRINTIQEPNIAPKSAWRNDLMGAIDRVQAKGVGLDPDDRNKIVDPDAYHQAVALEMRALGFKSFHDGEEIQVTRPGANHSEHFDISTAGGLVRRFYASWISPPAFE